jgi:hypothetical protein
MRDPPSPSVTAGDNYDPDEVLTFAEWCKLNKLSMRTGRRVLKLPEPNRPVIIQLSPNRIGITRRSNRNWQERRSS